MNRDRFITRLIPLKYIDAEAITNTLKPLVSKDANMVAYAPTNTIILTDSASNIRRILSILDSIDVETYREELAVLNLEHADAATLASQLAEIYGAENVTAAQPARRRTGRATTPTQPGAGRNPPRIITDDRTNSLIVLASRSRLEEIRDLVLRLDVPVTGTGRIHVYYLKHADAEELTQTLNALLSGQAAAPAAPRPGGQTPQALRSAVSALADGVTVTSDVGTNSLVIQGSKEAYATLAAVIDKLDIPRPQVLVEALIMEVSVGNNEELGFNGLATIFKGDTQYTIGSLTDSQARPSVFGDITGTSSGVGTDGDDGTDGMDGTDAGTDGIGDDGGVSTTVGKFAESAVSNLVAAASRNTIAVDPVSGAITGGTLIAGIIRASANIAGSNILSAPHILTSDNEEAEIKIGSNIPIVTSRVQSAAGQELGLATSQNIERRDIGVTLRVTPQITEGNTLRLDIFQEITAIDPASSAITGDPQEVGVSLSSRKVENTVVVFDQQTVVIGGLIGDEYRDTVNKVPWLGDIPILGWGFKSTRRELQKVNLLVFLTPHVIRESEDLEYQSIRKREEFRRRSKGGLMDPRKDKEQTADVDAVDEMGIPRAFRGKRNPARDQMRVLEEQYPLERMLEIEENRRQERDTEAEGEPEAGLRYRLEIGAYDDEGSAMAALTELVDAGYEGRLVSAPAADGVLYELHVGPYQSLDDAERVGDVLRKAFKLDSAVVVERPE
jgi:general secretion pathway protein D